MGAVQQHVVDAESIFSRRTLLGGAITSFLAVGIAACSDGATTSTATDTPVDYSERFAKFEVADEPNGDPSKVVLPKFVTAEGPEYKPSTSSN